MNKKAFTLVELLATIVIIGLIAGIGTVAYTTLISQSETKVYEAYEDTMHAEAVYRLTMKYDTIRWTGNKVSLSLKLGNYIPDGEKDDYINVIRIDPINNPNDSKDFCPSSYVEVTKSNVGGVSSYHYKVCLICKDYNSDGNDCEEYEN